MNRTIYGNPMDEVAMEFLRECCPPEGYWVAFSGGKDSVVILDLVRRAGVPHEAHYSITNVDPPELIWFIKEHYPDVQRDHPPKSMWRLIAEKGMPTRKARFCCEKIKERGGIGRWVVTGIRWAESVRRRNRSPVELARSHGDQSKKAKCFIHPIFNWSTADVWQYIHERGLPHCKLYDEGWKRIGCVVCPFAPDLPALQSRYPKLFEAALRAVKRWHAVKRADGTLRTQRTAEESFHAWVHEREKQADPLDTCGGLFV